MPYYCTVPRCTSMAGKAKNVSFHQFPRDEELANLWNEVLKRGKPYTKYSKVCSLHFKPEDYTITSVGKNKGQWRTLRKDAVPSQNLPSDTPVPWPKPRRASANALTSSPSRNSFNSSFDAASLPNVMSKDLVRGFEVAQAIYMQTMLAMQAAQAKSDGGAISNEPQNANSRSPSPTPSNTSSVSEATGIDLNSQVTESATSSYKCNDCSKCFKDPDVFIIHKRTHIKNGEKENLDLNLQNGKNEALKSNPILTNLLKNGMKPDVSNMFDVNSILSIENQIMTALAANMESYIRNLSGMVQTSDTNRNAIENTDFQSSNMKIGSMLESQFSNDNSQVGSAKQLENANAKVGNCDNDLELNRSVDSDTLVIDETA